MGLVVALAPVVIEISYGGVQRVGAGRVKGALYALSAWGALESLTIVRAVTGGVENVTGVACADVGWSNGWARNWVVWMYLPTVGVEIPYR